MEEKVVAGKDISLEPGFDRKVTQNMILMLLGKFVSFFGTYIYTFAIGLYVLSETKSGMTFATTLLCGTLPRVLLGPFAGALADIWDRKKMVVLMDFISGIIVFGLLGLATINTLQVGYIYVVAFLLSICSTFFDVNIDSSMPNLVDDKRLMKLNSYNSSVTSIAEITAPLLGGVIYGLISIKLFLFINAISFILSGISELFIDFELTLEDDEEEKTDIEGKEHTSFQTLMSDMKEGFAFLKEAKTILILTTFLLGLNFVIAFGFTVPLPYIVVQLLKLSSEQYGFIMGSFPIGLLLGSLILSRIPDFKNVHRVTTIGFILFGLMIFLTGVPAIPSIGFSQFGLFIYFCALVFLFGGIFAFVNVPLVVQLQRGIPDNYRGRVFGLLETVGKALLPIGYILAGFLIKILPGYIIPMISGLGLIMFIVTKYATNEKMKAL